MSPTAGDAANEDAPSTPGVSRITLAVLLFGSGVAALLVETTWLRWLRLLLGATAPAVSATLVAFFLGGALGALAAARWLPRARNPLLVYGLLEIAASAWGLAVPALLDLGGAWIASDYDALQSSATRLTTLRFGVALLATLPAAACYGATLPAIAAAVLRDSRDLGRTASGLYAVNTAGAATGVALASFWLPAWLGVWPTYAGALTLSAVVGFAAVAMARTSEPAATAAARSSPRPEAAPLQTRLLAVAALSGFGSFAGQVLFVQGFGQVLDQSVHAFGAVLVCVLASLALGGALVSMLAARGLRAEPTLVLALTASALGFVAFPALLHFATEGLTLVVVEGPWSAYVAKTIEVTAFAAGPALLASALVFPTTFALAETGGHAETGSEAGAWLGALIAVNTAGAIAGALLAPYVLLPWLGPWQAHSLLAFAYAAAAVAYAITAPGIPRRAFTVAAIAVAAGVAGTIAAPGDFPLTRLEPGARLVEQRSTPAGVVSVIERPSGRLIRTDNHYALGGSGEVVHQERQGHLPLLLHTGAERVAFVGTATGITAGAALAHPVQDVVLVELVPDVARAARQHFSAWNRDVHRDPRSTTVIDDARNYFANTSERFDVVVADLFVPWRAGTGALYTLEHFTTVRARLREAGVFVQWLPLYQLERESFFAIAAAFHAVFETAAVFRGDFYGGFPIIALVGWRDTPASPERVVAAAAALKSRGERDRWVTDGEGVFALYVGPLDALGDELARARPNSDDHPRVEFLSARAHAGSAGGPREPLVGMAWIALSQRLRAASTVNDPIYPALPEVALRAAAGGEALQLAGAYYVDGRTRQASEALRVAAERLPMRLLGSAEADPSAADLWHTNAGAK